MCRSARTTPLPVYDPAATAVRLPELRYPLLLPFVVAPRSKEVMIFRIDWPKTGSDFLGFEDAIAEWQVEAK